MSIVGVILQLAYRVRQHFWLGWSLARWLGSLLVAAGLVCLVRCWGHPWPALLVAGLLLGYVLCLAWAARRGYVRFRAAPEPQALFRDGSPAPPLQKEERVPLRASGWFSVEGRAHYWVDLEADFETVGTREHIVLARVYPSRFLALGTWPGHELGWWYIFFQPAMLRGLSVGHLDFGPQPRLALRVVYEGQEGKMQAIHLTFADALALRRVRDDLLRDAPPGMGAAA